MSQSSSHNGAAPSASDEFSKTYDEALKQLKFHERRGIQGTSIEGVWKQIRDIQNTQSKSKTLRNMQRIEHYVKGLKRYAGVIEVFVQAKPDLLALIWGPIKLILCIARNYLEVWDKIMDIIQKIGDALPQFLDLKTELGRNEQFGAYLSLFYKEILDFHVGLLKFFRSPAWERFLSAIWPRNEAIFDTIIENICRHKELLDRQLTLTVVKKLGSLRTQNINSQLVLQKELNRQRVHRYLEPFDYNIQYRRVRDKICPGTNQWILTNRVFEDWLEPGMPELKHRLLWLVGIPGAGKSHVSVSVVDITEDRVSRAGTGRVLFVLPTYNNYGAKNSDAKNSDIGNNARAIFRSLIFQLCRTDMALAESVGFECESGAQICERWSDAQWKDLLIKLLQDSNDEPCYVILDGLDECQDGAGIVALVVSLLQQCDSARVLISSRPEDELTKLLPQSGGTELRLDTKNGGDIEIFARTRIESLSQQKLSRYRKDPKIQSFLQSLPKRIACAANGLFLFARLVLDNIACQSTIKQMLSEADQMPKDLGEIYNRILQGIKTLPVDSQDKSKRIFAWLLCAKRPLRRVELEDAIKIEEGESELDRYNATLDSLKKLCGCLIEDSGQYVIFVHYSAKEFLTSARTDPFISRADAAMLVSAACMTYLRFDYYEERNVADDAVLDQFIQDGAYVLHDYVHSAWFSHLMDNASSVADTVVTARILGTLRDFLDTRGNPSFAATERPLMNLPTCLSTLCRSSSGETIEDRLRRVVDFEWHRNLKGNIDETRAIQDDPLTLSRSARRIHERFDFIAAKQCSGSCSPACKGLHDTYGLRGLFRCPVVACSRHWNTFATKTERDDHLSKHQKQEFICNDVLCNQYSRRFKTIEELDLHGHSCPVAGAKTSIPSNAMNQACNALDVKALLSVFGQIAKAGDGNLLRKLVPEVANTLRETEFVGENAKGVASHIMQALEVVVSHCPSPDVEYVFIYLFKIAAPVLVGVCKHPWKLLEIAMSQKNQPVAVFLWETLSPIYQEHDTKYLHPLLLAAGRGYRQTVGLLLERCGVEVNLKDKSGHTALWHATQNGHPDTVQLLLDQTDIDINSKGKDKETSLFRAVNWGHEAVVQMLLERDDVEADSKDSRGWTPLCWAASRRSKAIVKMLLERDDVEADSKDSKGRTPLSWAANWGHEAAVQMLLERDDIEADSKDSDGRTPLSWAAQVMYMNEERCLRIVRMLVKRGDVHPENTDSEGQTARQFAEKYGNFKIAEFLHPDSIRMYRSQLQRENSAHDQLASEASGHAG